MNTILHKNFIQNHQILKPDFSTMVGRKQFTDYLNIKFKQLLEFDNHCKTPIFKYIKPDFIQNFSQRLIENPHKKILIGIWGESASGKTTICNTISDTTKKLNLPIEIFSTDNYFRDISELIKKYGSFDLLLESGYDVDSPDNFNMPLLYEDLYKLSCGIDVKIPKYLVNGTGIVVDNAIDKKSQKIIVVEGMASMYGKVADLLDIKVYIDIDPEIQKKWFLYRAVTSRNQNEENALKQLEYVRSASKKYIIPQKNKADIFINGASSLEYFNQMVEYFYNITNNFVSHDNSGM